MSDKKPRKQLRPKAGRLTTDEVMQANGGIDLLCEQIVDGMSLRAIAAKLDIPHSNILKWLDDHPDYKKRYLEARIEQADTFANEIIAIADEPVPTTDTGAYDSGAVNDKRLRIDARKWVASKLKPGSYGEKLELSGGLKVDLTPEQIDKRIAHLLAQAGLTTPGGGDDGSKPSDA